MKVNLNKILSLIVVIAILVSSSSFTLAHDPSATPYPNLSHSHIKGKVTAPDGSVVRLPEGARISAKSSEVFRYVELDCHFNRNQEVTSPINPTTGEYELIFYFKADSEKCRSDHKSSPMSVDGVKLINAPGYEFKFKRQTP